MAHTASPNAKRNSQAQHAKRDSTLNAAHASHCLHSLHSPSPLCCALCGFRFAAFDNDKNGTVSAHEYLMYSLREALVQTKKRMVDLFKQWDEDRSGRTSLHINTPEPAHHELVHHPLPHILFCPSHPLVLCPSHPPLPLHPLSGTISEKEFKQAIKVLGYAVPPAVASLLYKKLDENHDNNLK